MTQPLWDDNIILIGMPGSGKSRLAELVGERLGRPAVNCDALAEREAGISIPELFARRGEAYFRQLETRVLRRVCAERGQVIATGGGCVTRPENREMIKKSGVVLWVRRDLDRLETEGRPLSLTVGPKKLYEERKAWYEALAQGRIDNNGEPGAAAESILAAIQSINMKEGE